MKPERFPHPRPWIVAHRGARDEAPENTRAALARALDYPIDGIELDVQLSADGVPVIHHDRTLLRVARRRWRVAGRTASELQQIDWGRWFGADFAGEPLLTLERTLALFAARTRLLIEVKTAPGQDAERLTRTVLSHLAGLTPEVPRDHIHILCFDPRVLALAARLAPGWRYVFNVPGTHPGHVMALAPSHTDHLWAIDVPIGRLSGRLVRR